MPIDMDSELFTGWQHRLAWWCGLIGRLDWSMFLWKIEVYLGEDCLHPKSSDDTHRVVRSGPPSGPSEHTGIGLESKFHLYVKLVGSGIPA